MTDTLAPVAAAEPRSRAGRAPRSLRVLPGYVPAAVIAVGAWAHRWTDEDAFINFRILDNLFAGHGPVFNAGERVEAGTSPLWIGVLAVGRALLGWVLAIEWIAVLLGLAAAVAAFALGARGALVAAGVAGAPAGAATVVGASTGVRTGGAIEAGNGAGPGAGGGIEAGIGGGMQAGNGAGRGAGGGIGDGTGAAARSVAGGGSGAAAGSVAGGGIWPGAGAGGGGVVVPVGLLAVSSVAVVWDFARSGLETSLTWSWIAGCWYVLCRAARGGEPSSRRRAAGAALIGLAPLVRPDLGVMMLCGAVAWFLLVRPRRVVFDLTAMFALPVAYQVFRMGYYATLVPSTALAKDAGGLHVDQGWGYLRDFAGPYRLWLPVAVIVATITVRLRSEGDRRAALPTLAMVAAAVLHAGYIVAIGGDYMHGRLLLPALFALAVPAYVVVRRPDVRSLALCTLAGAWALVAVVAFRPPPPPAGSIPRIADWRQMTGARVVPLEVEVRADGTTASEFYASGARGYMKALAPDIESGRDPDELVVVLGAIGVVGYQLGPEVTIVDISGLAEPLAARTDPDPGSMAGHRKQIDGAWYDARFGVVDEVGEVGDDRATRDAARALTCAPIDDLLDAITEDLTPGRFLANIWHSPANTRLHIPADPTRAVAELC